VLAETPEQALELLQTAAPNALIVDTNWSERCAKIMSTLMTTTPVPVLTCPLPSVHHLGLMMGATDYLPKPVTREDLATALIRLPTPPRTALVVDDDPHIVRLIGRMLKSIDANLRVLEAFGGDEGLAIARSHRPDVVFLDLVMPEVTGYNFIQKLAVDPTLGQTAIIVVSVRSIEQETAPLLGELRIQRAAGFSLTEMLQTLRSVLSAVTQPETVSPTSAAALLEASSG
jgi:CheY-like chemotaxis protein